MPYRESEESKRYHAEYRAKHREELREAERKRRIAKAAEIKAQRDAFRAENRERLRVENKRWYWDNKEFVNLKDRARYWNNPERRKQCIEDSKRRYRANPNKLRSFNLLKTFGLTLEQWDAMVVAQCGRCAICRRPMDHRLKEPHVDHDHASGRIRGLLCNNCNNGLGRFLDSPKLLRAAADYLEAYLKGTS